MPRPRILVTLALALLAACTMGSAIDAMTSPEDRAFAQAMVDNLRHGNADWLERRFDDALWEQSAKQMGQAAELYPAETGTTRIVGFHVASNRIAGRSETSKEFTLVTEGGGRWTTTFFRTHSAGGPERVVEWRVTPHDSPPPELEMIETWDAMVPWIWAGLLIVLLGAGALIFWLVRRSRRSDSLMGRRGG